MINGQDLGPPPELDDDDLGDIMPHLDLILACVTDLRGPRAVVLMLREKADLIEAISQRRMH